MIYPLYKSFFLWLAFFLAFLAYGEDNPQTVHMVVACHWEGEELNVLSLQALKNYRDAHPQIPFTHFLNAAYFTKPDADPKNIMAALRMVIRPQDNLAMELTPWASLLKQAKVPMRYGSSFWGRPLSPSQCEAQDCGRDVPLSIFEKGEIKQIITTAKNVLNHAGFPGLETIHITGWTATPDALAAAAELGFSVDMSAIDLEDVRGTVGGFPLFTEIRDAWKINSRKKHLSFMVPLTLGAIQEIPTDGVFVEYASSSEAQGRWNAFTEKLNGNAHKNSGRIPYFYLGIVQESAGFYLPSLESTIKYISETAPRRQIALKYYNLPNRAAALLSFEDPAKTGPEGNAGY